MGIKKIAFLNGFEEESPLFADFKAATEKAGIIVKTFLKSEEILPFSPDCVIVCSPQDARLTPFPTYGLLNKPYSAYLELPRFVRNLLSYDGYLSTSPKTHEVVTDLLFGARKLGAEITLFDLTPMPTTFMPPDFSTPKLFAFTQTGCAALTQQLTRSAYSVQSEPTQGTIGLCLDVQNPLYALLPTELLQIIACSALAIVPRLPALEKIFGDSLLYLDIDSSPDETAKEIIGHCEWSKCYPELAKEKAKKAHDIFVSQYSMVQLLNNLQTLHEKTLIQKGYVPHPEETPETLPSVSYIIRTGGRYRPFLERALESLRAQRYPNLHVIFVLYKDFDYMTELFDQYPELQFSVVKCYNSIRSKSICDGMAAVKTDLFGMLDDDDELHPNHIRSLVNTLRYHNQLDWRGPIGMAYSGAIKIHTAEPMYEPPQFQDSKLINRQERYCIEHFRFYRSQEMAQHLWFMMSNSWLARRSLIDAELLTDPSIDTCEDLYFELQLAQRTQFAFSVEATAIHHFHQIGNSTLVDKDRHIPDSERIALRNFSRSYPTEIVYDSVFNRVCRPNLHTHFKCGYHDVGVEHQQAIFATDPYFSHRQPLAQHRSPVVRLCLKIIHLGMGVLRFIVKPPYPRREIIMKSLRFYYHYGLRATLKRICHYQTQYFQYRQQPVDLQQQRSWRHYWFLLKMNLRYFGVRNVMSRIFAKLRGI